MKDDAYVMLNIKEYKLLLDSKYHKMFIATQP